jgi:hypothetical protein
MAARDLLRQVGDGERSRHVAERGHDQHALKLTAPPERSSGAFCVYATGGAPTRVRGDCFQRAATVVTRLIVIACAFVWQANSSALPSSIWWSADLWASTASSKRVGA